MIIKLAAPVSPVVKKTIRGVTSIVGPRGEMLAFRVTVPEKPSMPFANRVRVWLEPANRGKPIGLREILKSCTITVTLVE